MATTKIECKEQCQKSGAAFYFKQWGGTNKKKAGSELKGEVYKEMPDILTEIF